MLRYLPDKAGQYNLKHRRDPPTPPDKCACSRTGNNLKMSLCRFRNGRVTKIILSNEHRSVYLQCLVKMKKKNRKTRGAIKIEVLKAAREMVLKLGYKNVSIRAIAGRSGYSVGAVYLHFKTKRDILAALREEGLTKLSERLAGLPSATDPFLGLRHLCVAFIDFSCQNQHLYQLICAFGIDAPTSITRDLLPSIETFLRQDSLSPQDRKDATIALAGLLFGLTNLYVTQNLVKIAPDLVVNDLYRILDIFLEAGGKKIYSKNEHRSINDSISFEKK